VELAQPLPAFNPGFLRKINRFLFIPHHAVGPGVNLIAMTGDQLLEGTHVTLLRRADQRLILCRGILVISHRFDGALVTVIQNPKGILAENPSERRGEQGCRAG
jgi:hypothetical protein